VTRPDVVDPADPDAGAPEWWRQARNLRRIPIILAILLAIVVFKAFSGSKPPPLTKSCTTPAFALSTTSVSSHKTVQWSATGPQDFRFTLGIGIARFDPAGGGRLTPVPDPGVGTHDIRATRPDQMGDDCTAHGSFGVALPEGTYAVRLFRIDGTGSDLTVTSVAEKKLTVTG
jgi:hypothetical protein